MRPMNSGNAAQPPGLRQQVETMWAQIPLFCRLILVVTLFTQILSFVIPSLPALLACIPNLVVYSFQRKLVRKLLIYFQFGGFSPHT